MVRENTPPLPVYQDRHGIEGAFGPCGWLIAHVFRDSFEDSRSNGIRSGWGLGSGYPAIGG